MTPSPHARRPVPLPAGPGQESVWDYPRPPRIEASPDRVVIRLGGQVIADTTAALRVLETSHPPVYYVPQASFPSGVLTPASGSSWCEFKGHAAYFDVSAGDAVVRRGGWHYPAPRAGFEQLAGMVAVYPGRMESCRLGDEVVRAQEGNFYGGWVTSRVVGPFKGEPGTMGW
jgi:uncharacterized protein (DUF427 family)|nr:DUF427 domain-containing protein [Mycetocola sp.]